MRTRQFLASHDTAVLIGLLALAMSTGLATGASLFGDPTCQDWGRFDYQKKRAWANAFFAPLSLTFKGLQKSKEDKYNDNPKAHEAAINSLDDFCLSHPNSGVQDAAGVYLKKLFE